MKKGARWVILPALALWAGAPARDAVGPWQHKLGFELLLNEGFYSNWNGDERPSGSVNAVLDHTASRQLTPRVRYEHEIALAFGEQVRQDSAAAPWRMSKSEDRIRVDELLRLTLGAWVDPLVAFQLKSQFVDGRDSVARHLNPLELLETGGVGRRFFDDSTRALSSQVGVSARQLFDARDTLGSALDAGVSWITAFRTKLFTKDAGYSTRLVAYKPLVALGGNRTIGRWPQFDWEHKLTARFNSALSGTLYVQILGEDDRTNTGTLVTRFKQTLGMGLSLAWPSGS